MQKGGLEVKELWEEICFILHGDISPSISEEMYEQKIIQSLEKMGWSRFRKEIILKQSIQLGSAGRIVPDIILKSLHNNQSFVIEVKKPSADIDNLSHKNQLISYMRQLKLEHSVLIGNQIQIYYDGKLNKEDDPILLESINFSESNQNGLTFLNLFHKDTFSYENIEAYAKEKITILEKEKQKNALLDLLLSSNYQNKMKEIMAENLHQEWDNEIVNNALAQITITLSHKKTAQPSHPVTQPQPIDQPLGEIKIGQLVRSKMNYIIKYCELYDNEEIQRLSSIDYSKSTFNINYPLLSNVDYDAPKQDKYWKHKYKINEEYYFVTSEWYKGSASLFEGYLKRISQHQNG